MPVTQLLSFGLYIAAIFAVSIGASSNAPWLVYTGFAAIIFASAITPLRRFLVKPEGEGS